MVTVEIVKCPQLRLTARGHAGAAPYGEDLVCAGISTLLCTLSEQLRQTGGGVYTRLESGNADLRAVRTAQTVAAFSFAETGLRLLAAQHPEHLRFVSL